MTDSKFKFICFSDIDGTLVHYLSNPQQLQEVTLDTRHTHPNSHTFT